MYNNQVTILFVEENADIREVFKKSISNKISNLILAENSNLGFELYKSHHPDIVITDISMPSMLEMIKRMKEFDHNVNVVAMSSYNIKEFFLEAIKIGVNGYLMKPVDSGKLNTMIDEVSSNILMIRALDEKERNRRIAEENLKKSLAEKELLLKEVHHRVKNNLQIISSILKMQERIIDDPKLKTILGESQNRIRSMALIHENLYRNESLANINFANYVKSLASNLARSYAFQQEKIKFEFKLDENLFLPIDIGIPLGLIINELISNSFKHAFVGRDLGTIFVSLKQTAESDYILHVGDDGVGIENESEITDSGSLGMKIVAKLLQQIDGKVIYNFGSGTHYYIRFSG